MLQYTKSFDGSQAIGGDFKSFYFCAKENKSR